MEKWEGPQTESLKRRGRKVKENGVVEGKDFNAIVVGFCIFLGGLTLLIAYLVG